MAALKDKLYVNLPLVEWAAEEGVDQDGLRGRIATEIEAQYANLGQSLGFESLRNIEKQILLQTIDAKWREHLLKLEYLRSVVGFRAYAQRDPLLEFKNEAFTLFGQMLETLRADVLTVQYRSIRLTLAPYKHLRTISDACGFSFPGFSKSSALSW